MVQQKNVQREQPSEKSDEVPSERRYLGRDRRPPDRLDPGYSKNAMKSLRLSFGGRPCNLRCAALRHADLFWRDFCELTTAHSVAVNSAAPSAKTRSERAQYLANNMSAEKKLEKPVQTSGWNGLTPCNGNYACARRSDSTSKFTRVFGAFAPRRVLSARSLRTRPSKALHRA